MNIFKREIIEDEPEWYKFYDDVPHHLTYPNYSIYKMVEKAADKYPKNYAYNYFGTKTTYAKFIDEIDDVAKSLKVIGAKEDERILSSYPKIRLLQSHSIAAGLRHIGRGRKGTWIKHYR